MPNPFVKIIGKTRIYIPVKINMFFWILQSTYWKDQGTWLDSQTWKDK